MVVVGDELIRPVSFRIVKSIMAPRFQPDPPFRKEIQQQPENLMKSFHLLVYSVVSNSVSGWDTLLMAGCRGPPRGQNAGVCLVRGQLNKVDQRFQIFMFHDRKRMHHAVRLMLTRERFINRT